MRRSLVGLAGLIVVAVVATTFVRVEFLPLHHRPGKRGATSSGAPRASTTPSAVPAGVLMPGTLVIPKIGVNATVEAVTVDANDDMAVPKKPVDVGWYSPGVVPGQPGDAVIDGHLDWYGVPKAVFYSLDQLKAGDEVDVLDQNGAKLRFTVTDSSLVAATSHPAGLFATTGSARLTLITCAGDWNPSTGQYGQRLLVNASYAGTG